jgi:glutamate--cysteine ligase
VPPLRTGPAAATAPAWLRAEVEALLAGTRGPGRVGLEVEVLPVDIATRRPVAPGRPPGVEPGRQPPHGERTLTPLLRAALAGAPWNERLSASGTALFEHESGGVLSFEPGGQLEYATTPSRSLDLLQAELESVWAPLAAFLEREGVGLVARGLDPWNDVESAVLHATGTRYRRMAAHYDRRGPWGRRMMRQSAALHVNVDAPGPPGAAWAVANAAAPALLAMFANSHRMEGRDAGVRSARAAQWRRLDPSRTGIPWRGTDPVEEYLDFALSADDFLGLDPSGPAHPFRAHASTATRDAWTRHLTTLFPEVRPRGYLELRSVDALPLRWAVLPAAVMAGVLFDDTARDRALGALPHATDDALVRAGCAGLADPGAAAAAATLLDLAQEGLERLGDEVASATLRRALSRFRADLTDRGRDPGTAPGDHLLP